MDRNLTLIVFFFGVCMFSSYAIRRFHYINLPKTWDDARQYCKEHYTDLATVKSKKHLERLERPNMDTSAVWIGLRDYPLYWKELNRNKTNSWRWSLTGRTGLSRFENWYPGEPDNMNGEYCVFMDSQGMWFDGDCENLTSFVCFTESPEGQKTFVFIPTLKTWNYAQSYCKKFHTGLAMIESEHENTEISSTVPANATAWIGLYRLVGQWADGTADPFRNWKNKWPIGGNNCAAEQPTHLWETSNCDNNYTFLCHDDRPVRQVVVKMKIKTNADMTDPANSNNLLKQLTSALTRHGMTYGKLQWTVQPRKVKQPYSTEPKCDHIV